MIKILYSFLLIFSLSIVLTAGGCFPSLVDEINMDDDAVRVFRSNETLVVSDMNKGVYAYSLADASNPELLFNHDEDISICTDSVIVDNICIAADFAGGLKIFEMEPFPTDTFTFEDGISVVQSLLYSEDKQLLFVADLMNGLLVFEVSQVEPYLNLKTSMEKIKKITRMAVYEDLLFALSAEAGLVIINISNNLLYEIESVLDVVNYGFDLTLDSDYAYIADGKDGVKIIDVSDTVNPFIANTIQCSPAFSVRKVHNDLFIGAADNGLYHYVIENVNQPELLKRFMSNPIIDIQVTEKGDYVYCAAGEKGLIVYRMF